MRDSTSIEQQRKRIETLPPEDLEALKVQWLAYISEPVRLYHEPRIAERLPTLFVVWAFAALVEREEIPSF